MTVSARHVSPLDSEQRLAELLDAELGFSVSAQHGFVNHLAMTLVAATRLGASAERLEEIYAGQTADYLVERHPPVWLAPLTAAIVKEGIDAAVAVRLPPLLPAANARWFHALIRLEHAVDARHPGQVANALGDFREAAQPLPALPEGRGGLSLLEVARQVKNTGATAEFAKRSLRDIATHPAFTSALERARLGEWALADAAELALVGHIASNNFATLHLVTGSRAARALAPLLHPTAARELGERIAQAVFAGYLAGGKGRLPDALAVAELRNRAVPSASEIAAAAVKSDDAHVTKLAYACQREHESTGEALYPWVAARQCGLV